MRYQVYTRFVNSFSNFKSFNTLKSAIQYANSVLQEALYIEITDTDEMKILYYTELKLVKV